MRRLFLFLIVLLFSNFAKSQLNDFDLSNYKLSDIKRHQLDLNFNLSGSNLLNNRYGYDDDRKALGGDLDILYSFYRNSSKIQSDQTINFFNSSDFTRNEDGNSNVNEYKDIHTGIYINSENRFYKNDRSFIETDLTLDGNIIKYKREGEDNLSETNDKYLGVSLPIYIGTGRIEQIQDARLALYILEDLKKTDRLKRVPSEDEIFELSQFISKLKNERFFDSRIKKIEDLEKISAFLISKGIIETTDIKTFAIINDDWNYASTNIRESGNRFAVGIEPLLNTQKYKFQFGEISSLSTQEYKRTNYGVNINIKFDHEKPINLYWQSSFNFKITGGYLKGKYENIEYNSEEKLESPLVASDVNYKIGYYPNTRTDMELSVGANFIQHFGNEKIDGNKNEINYFNVIPQASFNLNYYISPKLELRGSYSFYFNYSESNSDYLNDYTYYTSKYRYHVINLGIVYQIF